MARGAVPETTMRMNSPYYWTDLFGTAKMGSSESYQDHAGVWNPLSSQEKVGDLEWMLMKGCTHWHTTVQDSPLSLLLLYSLIQASCSLYGRKNTSNVFFSCSCYLLHAVILSPPYILVLFIVCHFGFKCRIIHQDVLNLESVQKIIR